MNIPTIRLDLRVALLYAFFGGLWIWFSDHILAALSADLFTLTTMQTYKGWAFVLLSALLIYSLLRQHLVLTRRAETQLRESEQRYRQLFENSLDAILLTAPDGIVFAANPAACGIFRRTESEIKQIGRAGVVDANDPRLAIALETRARTGKFHGELTFLRRDGTTFPGEISSSLFLDQEGRPRTSMIIRDITERKRAEEAIKASHDRLDQILESISDAFVSLDTNWRYTHMNKKAGEIFNRNPKAMIGKHIWTEFPEGVGQPFHHAYEKALAEQKFIQLEEYYAPYDKWFENRIYPSRDGLSIFFHDVTDRKKAELLMAGEKTVMEKIATGAQLPEILDAIALSIETQSSGIFCSVLLMDADGKRLRHGGAPRLPDEFNRAIDGGFIGPSAGSCGTAAYRKQPVIVADISNDPLWSEYRDIALKHGLQACWSMPILSVGGGVLGTFAMYYCEPREPKQMDFNLLDRATHLTKIAIERKQTEQALQLERDTNARIMETSPVGIAFVNEEGNITFANRRAEDVLGLSKGDITQRAYNAPSWRITDFEGKPFPDDRLPFGLVMTTKQPVRDVQHAIEWPDGKRVFLSINAAPFIDEAGKLKGMVAAIEDITERRRAAEELQRSEHVLRLFVEHSPAAIAMFDCDMNYIVASHRYRIDYDLGEMDLTGRSHYEIFPEMPDRWKEIHRRCLAGATERAEEDPFPRTSGKLDWVKWEIRPWYERTGEIGGIILFSEVITERKLAEGDTQRRLKEMEALYEASLSFTHLQEIRVVGEHVLQHLEQMLKYERGAIALRDDTSGELRLLAHARMGLAGDEHKAEIERVRGLFTLPKGITRWVAEHGEPVLTGDVKSDPRYVEADPLIQSELAVPLQTAGRIIGALNVESREANAFSEHDKRLLMTVANVAAVAIQNARLLQSERDAQEQFRALTARLQEVREEERAHIAREIHDELGQALTGLKMDLSWCSGKMAAEQSPLLEKTHSMIGLVDETIRTIRRIATELRPGILDDLGLIAAIEWQAGEFQNRSGITCSLTTKLEHLLLDDARTTALFRIFQESLTNVARHSEATHVDVRLTKNDGFLTLEITDDGKGISQGDVLEKKSLGLLGMKERAAILGGELTITGAENKGTTVRVTLPV
jgi:PAS domain S-box-containing protein